MKATIITVIVLIILGVGGYFLYQQFGGGQAIPLLQGTENTGEDENQVGEGVPVDDTKTVLGTSVEGRSVMAYHYGTGTDEVLFIGGIHGGYEWNTSLVAFELMDYLEANQTVIPANVKVTVIPVMNPDGLFKVVGTDGKFTSADVKTTETTPGRFNGNNVDLNRNFDCDWQASALWQNKSVSGGTEAFSEPESKAIKAYVETKEPKAVIVWYSSAGGVFASNCHRGVSEETNTLTKLYADASGYKAYQEFNFYEITGDMVNWLAQEGIPAISVLLTTHEDTEWSMNQKGIEAVLKHYATPAP